MSKSGKGGGELNLITDRVTLAKAFQLAHSLYRFRNRDRQIALTIVSEALNGVQVRLIAQQEADRHAPLKPTKVRWNTQQWFQLLIYCKSEVFEQQQEHDREIHLSHEDMIIRYLKHVILTTSRRNSFHACLGLTRLIYDYSASGTMAIYDMIFQDPDASTRKSDAYYRERKNRLLNELARRFAPFVRIEQGLRGEKRFQPDSHSNRFAQLVVEYLKVLTPWDTACTLPPHLDAWTTVHGLQFSHPNQIHSLIDPTCFARITGALKLDDPDTRLTLPRFFLGEEEGGSEEGGGSLPDDHDPLELTSDEAFEIKDKVDEQRRLRKKFVANSLSILGDGIERARFNLAHSSRFRFEIDEDIKLIEIVGHNEKGDLLLATHIVSQGLGDSGEEAQVYFIEHEAGRKISLRLVTDDSVASGNLAFEISYEENRIFSPIRQWWHDLTGHGWKNLIDAPAFRLAVVALVLIALIATLYFALRNDQGDRIARVEPPSSIEPRSSNPGTASPVPTATTEERKPPASPGTPDNRVTPGNTTRDQTIRANKSLLRVQRIYIESFGDDVLSQSLRRELNESLKTINRFTVMNGPDEADTAISGSIRNSGATTLQLVNASGDIIWTRTYRGTAAQIAIQFTKDLLAAIETEKH